MGVKIGSEGVATEVGYSKNLHQKSLAYSAIATTAGTRGPSPDCDVREIPERLVATAKRHGLLPEMQGTADDSMLGVPGQ